MTVRRLLTVILPLLLLAAIPSLSGASVGIFRLPALAGLLDLVQLAQPQNNQPDMQIKNDGEPSFVGDNIYSPDGSGQSASQMVDNGVTAVYRLKLQNDWGASDSFRVTAPAGPSGWTVKFYDHLGAEVTAQVTGGGWTSPVLAPGASVEFRAEVTPDSTVPGGSTLSELITGTSVANPSASDAVLALTTVTGYQPDMQIRNSWETLDTDFVGNNVYNATGNGQTKAQPASTTTKAIYHLRLQNDGAQSDTFKVTGTAGGAGWTVQYFDAPIGGNNITGQITSPGGWTTGPLAPDAHVDFRVEVQPDGTVPLPPNAGSLKEVLVTATSLTSPLVLDAVKAATTNGSAQPDMLIRRPGDAEYIRDGAPYQDAATTDQLKTQPTSGTAVFHLRVENDGTTFDRFTVTGTAGTTAPPTWSVVYRDSGGADITAQVTSPTGWQPPGYLDPGDKVDLTLYVTPSGAVPNGDTYDVFVTVKSQSSGTLQDAVQARTIKAVRVYQPDAWIRNDFDDPTTDPYAFVGDNIYNLTGDNQERRQDTAQDTPAVYILRFQNDQTVEDRFEITVSGVDPLPTLLLPDDPIPPDSDGWIVEFFDVLTGTDITRLVRKQVPQVYFPAPPPPLPPMPAGYGYYEIRMEVTPTRTVRASAEKTVWVKATSMEHPVPSDVVRAVTRKSPSWPDMLIETSAEAVSPNYPNLAGDNVYNGDGTGQTKLISTAQNVPATYHLRLQNDRDVTDSFIIRGGGGGGGWTVQYFSAFPSGGSNITSAVTSSSGWNAGSLAPGAIRDFRVVITPTSADPDPNPRETLIKATSVGDPGRFDVVKAVTTKGPLGPDIMIRNQGEEPWTGNNIFNTTGNGQTKTQSVVQGVGAVYEFRIQNDLYVQDTISIAVNNPAVSGWTVTSTAPANVTLGPQATSAVYTLTVTPTAASPNPNPLEVTISATSGYGNPPRDVIKAITWKATARPDMLIKNSSETLYGGDNLYNATGAGQTRSQSAAAGTVLTYHLQVQNDGDLNDTIRVTGGGGGAGWTINYFDAITGGNNITAQVIGTGWDVPLAPGASRLFRLEVTPPSSGTRTTNINATSLTDGTQTDRVVAITAPTTDKQANIDAHVRNQGETSYTGDNLYNTTAAGQTKAQTVAVGTDATYQFRIENDTTVDQTVTITPTFTSSGGWVITFYDAGWNVISMPYTTGTIAAGATLEFNVTVNPTGAATNYCEVLLTAVGNDVAGTTDAVKLITSRDLGVPSRPDGLIRNRGEAAFIGGNIYNNTGAGQTKSQTAARNATVVFELRAENDGTASDSLNITCPPPPAGWTVAFFDALTGGTDITAQVTGAGWAVALGAGQGRDYRVEVTPTATAAFDSVLSLNINATSGALTDRVVATTEVQRVDAVRPDMWINTDAGGDAYAGNNIYAVINTDPPPTYDVNGQTKSYTVSANETAVFLMTVENDQPVADTFRIQEVDRVVDPEWNVVYLYDHDADPNTDPQDITSQVVGSGFSVVNLAPGATFEFWMEVTPNENAGARDRADGSSTAVKDIYVRAMSQTDNSKWDVVCAHTALATSQPDLLIRNSTEPTYNLARDRNVFAVPAPAPPFAIPPHRPELEAQFDHRGQVTQQTVGTDVPAIYYLKIINSNGDYDRYRVQEHEILDWYLYLPHIGFQVNYYDAVTGGNDITSQVQGAGWITPRLAPGESIEFRLEVKPLIGLPMRPYPKQLEISAKSVGDESVADAVRADTHKADDDFQPDMLIRNPTDAPGKWTGEFVYNTTGDQQTKTQDTMAGVTVTFPVRLVNASTVYEQFFLRYTPSAPDGWTVRFFDAATGGNDITAQVTSGSGWVTRRLAPRNAVPENPTDVDHIDLRIEMTPDETVPPNMDKEVIWTAVSITNGAKQDAVKAVAISRLFRPDMHIQNAGEPDHIGDNIYNTDASQQTKQQTIPAGNTAVYNLRLQNDGSVVDSFTLRGTGSAPGWTVLYFDRPDTGGSDITAQVTAGTYAVGNLAPDETVDLRVEVTPTVALNGDEFFQVLLTATSVTDNRRQDAVAAGTFTLANPATDLMIRNSGDASFIGDDIINTDGLNQTKEQTVTAGVAAVYHVRIQNQGNVTDRFVITGTAGGGGWTVSYFDSLAGGNNITSAVTGTGWSTAYLAPGATRDIRVEVTPDATVPGNTTKEVLVSGVSGGSPTTPVDVVKAITTKAEKKQADMWITNDAGPTFVGDNIYNNTGANQTRSQSVARNVTAVYGMRIENDGNVTDTFRITGTAGGGGWTVRYFNAITGGSEITSDITGAGWVTSPIPANAWRQLRVEVTADETLPANSVKDVLVTAIPVGGTSAQADTVRATTTLLVAYKADMQIRNLGETPFIGVHIYNNDGTNQTKAQSVLPGQTAVYELRVVNDGNETDYYTITGSAGGSGWTVRYYSALVGGVDVTDLVTGPGWQVGPLAMTTERRFRVEVTPDSSATPGTPKDVLVTGRSVADGSQSDTVKATTNLPAVTQPDALIRNQGEASFVGDGVYNNTGAGQTRAQTVGAGGTAVYRIRVENDGNLVDNFHLNGTPGDANWQVRYFDASSNDITVWVTGGVYTTGNLAPGAGVEIRAEVTPSAAVPQGAVYSIFLRASRVSDPTNVDTVRADTTKSNMYRPDMLIRNSGETNWTGNDIYNNDGTDQTRTQTVSPGTPAVYELRAQNDGNTSDSIRITGTAGGGGWTVRYFDALTGGTDITTQVTGAGWTTPALAAGAAHHLRVEVTPDSTLPDGDTKHVLVTGTSVGDPTKSDTVRATTTVNITYQPDMLIRNAGAAGFVGDNLYNTDGTGQTQTQNATPTTAAVYQLRVQNDGNGPDNVIVTGTAGGGGWTVTYYDAATGGNDITGLVVSTGWQTPSLPSGASLDLRVEVRPDASVPIGQQKQVLVRGTSFRDPLAVDVVQAVTTRAVVYAVDMLIKNPADAGYTGLGIINNDGTNQTRAQGVVAGAAAVYHLRANNGAGAADSIRITGTAGGAGWTVRYFDALAGGTEVTAQVTGAGWTVAGVAAGGFFELRCEVTPDGTVPDAATKTVLVTATSVSDPTKADTVRADTTKTAGVADNVLTWNPATRNLLWGTQDVAASGWYRIGAGPAEVYITVSRPGGGILGQITRYDVDGGHHGNAVPVRTVNSLQFNWVYSGATLSRLTQKSQVVRNVVNATYDAATGQTTIGGVPFGGAWELTHTFNPPQTIVQGQRQFTP